MPNSTPLNIMAIATAVPGQEKRLRSLQEKLVSETLKEPGCLRYELHQSLEDQNTLIFIESWADEEAWRAHMRGQAIKRFQDNGGPHLIQDFVLHRMVLTGEDR
jgi:quinol monooxygenase YgiN